MSYGVIYNYPQPYFLFLYLLFIKEIVFLTQILFWSKNYANQC